MRPDPKVAQQQPQLLNMDGVRIDYSVDNDELLASFKHVMEQMHSTGGTVNPRHFFDKFTDLHQQFSGGDQHDSHELLRHLLDSMLYVGLMHFETEIQDDNF